MHFQKAFVTSPAKFSRSIVVFPCTASFTAKAAKALVAAGVTDEAAKALATYIPHIRRMTSKIIPEHEHTWQFLIDLIILSHTQKDYSLACYSVVHDSGVSFGTQRMAVRSVGHRSS